MDIQLNIYGSPWQSNAAEDALAFASAALEQGHTIKRIFFYFDGVYHGVENQAPASDEFNILSAWAQLKEKGTELLLCIAASANRGVLNQQEAERYEKNYPSASTLFEITGLGQWAAGFNDCEKRMTFK